MTRRAAERSHRGQSHTLMQQTQQPSRSQNASLLTLASQEKPKTEKDKKRKLDDNLHKIEKVRHQAVAGVVPLTP